MIRIVEPSSTDELEMPSGTPAESESETHYHIID
jgi:hypothetical protein